MGNAGVAPLQWLESEAVSLHDAATLAACETADKAAAADLLARLQLGGRPHATKAEMQQNPEHSAQPVPDARPASMPPPQEASHPTAASLQLGSNDLNWLTAEIASHLAQQVRCTV